MNLARLNLSDLSSKGRTLLSFLQDRVIGQEQALDKIARAMEIAEADFGRKNRPLLNLLFLGPSGVGKSLIPSVLAEFYFKNRSAYTRLSGPDFAESHAIATVQGSPPGYVGFLDHDHYSEEEIWKHPHPLLSQWNIDKHEFNYLYRDSLDKLGELIREMRDQLKLAKTVVAEIKKIRGTKGEDYRKAVQVLKQIRDRLEELASYVVEYRPDQNYRSIVSFDEIEKGSDEFRNIILSIAESGTLDLKDGRTTRFFDSIIFCTSNAGSEPITKLLSGKGFGFYGRINITELNPRLLEQIQETAMTEAENFFPAEFLNRFDATIVFAPLSRQHLEKIFDLELGYLLNDLRSVDCPLVLEISSEAKSHIIDRATKVPEYGARELKRKLEQAIREPLAVLKNSGQIAKDDKIFIGLEKGQTVFYKDSVSIATTNVK